MCSQSERLTCLYTISTVVATGIGASVATAKPRRGTVTTNAAADIVISKGTLIVFLAKRGVSGEVIERRLSQEHLLRRYEEKMRRRADPNYVPTMQDKIEDAMEWVVIVILLFLLACGLFYGAYWLFTCTPEQ